MVTAVAQSDQTIANLESVLREVAVAVQLPGSLATTAEQEFWSLASWLDQSVLRSYSPYLYAQGSWRIGTTVRPIGQDEFDIDLVVEMRRPPSDAAESVYASLADHLEASYEYGARVERRNRCVRLQYPGSFHLDVVPAVTHRARVDGTILVPDKSNGRWSWQTSNPRGYVRWFESRAAGVQQMQTKAIEPLPVLAPVAEKTALQIAVQLAKRHHHKYVDDEKRTPSIVLTTLLAQSEGSDISARLAAGSVRFLEIARGERSRQIPNPSNPGEILSGKWDDPEIWRHFREWAVRLASDLDDLVSLQGAGIDVLAKHLGQMFGETEIRSAIESIATRARNSADLNRLWTAPSGVLSESLSPMLSNPPKTFFGDD